MEMYGDNMFGGETPSLNPAPFIVEMSVEPGGMYTLRYSGQETAAPDMNPARLGETFGFGANEEQFGSLEQAMMAMVRIVQSRS